MKFWLLTTEYPPQFGGGIGTYCEQWCRQLVVNQDDVTVFLPNSSVQNYKVSIINGVRIVEFSPFLVDTSGFLGFETMLSYSFAEIIKIFALKEGTPDWLEAQEYNGIAYYILQKKHLGEEIYKDLKVVITCHAPSFLYFEFNHINQYKLPYFWIGEMEKFCIEAADLCISPSQYLVDCLKARHPFTAKFHVLHNPYTSKTASYKTETALENKAVFLAKLSPSKGILQTLDSFKSLWNAGYTFKLKLIGDSNYYYHAKQIMMGDYIKSKYQKFIKNGLLELTGVLEPFKVKEEVKSAKFVLIPSTVDNFPYTVLECMSANKIVLASKQGGHQEIIVDGENGFLFDHTVPGQFSEKIKELFLLSNEKIEAVSEKAFKTVKTCCDPESYYSAKIKLLKSTDRYSGDQFPFTRKINLTNFTSVENVFSSNQELLSVVIPYFNMGKYIHETVTSILHSSYKNIEIIIVNDGSDDPESLAYLENIKKDSKIRIINQPNKGLSEARNTGALQASGKYLAFLDADDLVHPAYYTKALTVLKNKANVHFVGCWVQYFEGSTNVWPTFNPEPPYILFHNMVNSSGLIYKKDSFCKSGLNDSTFIYGMEDYDSVVNLVSNGFNGVVLPEILFNYRVRKGSMARGFNTENKSYLYKLLLEKHYTFYKYYFSEVINLINANEPGFNVENPTLDYHLFNPNSKKSKILRKIYMMVKQKPLLRKIALKGYTSFKRLKN